MNRIIGVASIVLTLAWAMRPAPVSVMVSTAEQSVRLDSATQTATVHVHIKNSTRRKAALFGCLGAPTLDVERHVAGRWIKVDDFPCPRMKAYPTDTLAKHETRTLPLRIHGKGEYRLSAYWMPPGYEPNLSRTTVSEPFEVR